jgi:putative hydrolase of the HAD superfamily
MTSVVLFDLDDTLFAHRGAVQAGVLAQRQNHGGAFVLADDAAELHRWTQLEELHYHRYLSGELDFLEQRRERARDFVAPYGLDLSDDAAADTWFDAYLEQYRDAWMLLPDALPCLDELRRRLPGVRFGIITNGELAFQTAKLDAVGLSPHLEHVIASGHVGFAKPDPRIFLLACGLFGVTPASAAYVGDRLRTDAIGARDAGLTGVWLDRPEHVAPELPGDPEDPGVPRIRSLAELPDLLAPTR